MPMFRKKPVVIEAMQLKYEDGGVSAIMDWAATHHAIIHFDQARGLSIDTLEGVMHAEMGDWIIKGVAGEFYPCKPDIFDATYETVDSAREQKGERMREMLERISHLNSFRELNDILPEVRVLLGSPISHPSREQKGFEQ